MSTSTKIHEPSARKQARARERGDVVHSALLGHAALFGALAWGLALLGPHLREAWAGLFRACLASVRSGESTPLRALGFFRGEHVAFYCALLGAPCVLVLLGSLVQTSFAWSSVGERHRGTFLMRALPFLTADHAFEQAFSVLRLGLVAGACWLALAPSLRGLLDLWQSPLARGFDAGLQLTCVLAARAAMALGVLGGMDIVYRSLRRRQRLRMTRRELEQERRATEGDPQLLGERRRRLRALSHEAGLAELSRASLVVHVATERAVALRFSRDEHAAPVVWVKGRGELAARMVEHATREGLRVHTDLALVAALERLEVSEPIPRALYARVAQLLAADSA